MWASYLSLCESHGSNICNLLVSEAEVILHAVTSSVTSFYWVQPISVVQTAHNAAALTGRHMLLQIWLLLIGRW